MIAILINNDWYSLGANPYTWYFILYLIVIQFLGLWTPNKSQSLSELHLQNGGL